MKLVNIGFGNMISAGRLIAVVSPESAPIKRMIQEVNRESNTIGSKCNDVAIAEIVVALKAEVEKMREQVQNVE